MVPTSTKAVIAGVRSRKRVRRPCESMATPGQNVSSKTKNTFRLAMMRLRRAKAAVRTHSARQPSAGGAGRASGSACELNEDLLELGLAHLAVAHQHALLHQPAQHFRQPLLAGIHRALQPVASRLHLQNSAELGEAGGRGRIEPQRDHVAEADLALERVRRALREDAAALDERDAIAELLRLPHVVGGEDDGGAVPPAQLRDLLPDP